MCNWRAWIVPGLVFTVVLAVLATWLHGAGIERDILARAKSALHADHAWAKVEANARDLVLTGIAPDENARLSAAAIISNTRGVRTIADRSELPPVAAPFVLVAEKGADGLTISGNIADETMRTSFISLSETVMPGIQIEDDMDLARGVPGGFAELGYLAITQLAGMAAGSVQISDNAYSISAVALDSRAYVAEVERLVERLPGGGVLASIDIAPPASAGDYGWTAEKTADGDLILSGHAPSLEARDGMIEAARAVSGGATVEDEIEFASGSPEGFGTAVAFALGQLALLEEGHAELVGLHYSLTGRALTTATGETLENAVRTGLPAGFEAQQIDIAVPLVPPTGGDGG
jgi:osmotically-inducible protein OsmY